MRKLFLFLVCIVCFMLHSTYAQKPEVADITSNNQVEPSQQDQVEMADALRKNGKIYVVVAVISVILGGLFIYLFALDRKIGRIEKEINKNLSNKV